MGEHSHAGGNGGEEAGEGALILGMSARHVQTQVSPPPLPAAENALVSYLSVASGEGKEETIQGLK